MDQTTFLNELLTVKDRVTEMASTFNHSPRPQHPPTAPKPDLFSDHLEDVKARLQSMQTSLDLLSAGQSQKVSPRALSLDSINHPAALPSIPSAPSALPSGPLFWQLFNSLRAEVRGLTDRVGGVEREISDLEDRLDDMQLDRFTPPSSEDMHFSMPPHHGYPSLDSEDQPAVYCGQYLANSGPIPPQPSRQHGASTQSSVTAEPTEHGPPGCPAPEGVAFRDREIMALEVALEDRVRDLQDSLRRSEDLVAESNQLRSERDIEKTKVAALCQRLRGCSDMITHRTSQVNNHDNAMENLAATMTRNHDIATRHLLSTLQQKSQELLAAEQRIDQLQRLNHDLKSNKQDETDEMLAEKDEALHRLKCMAARNNAIVLQQQQIITRGAAIMEERDAEIERLSQELIQSQEDDSNEQKERESCAKLLIERLTRELSESQASYRDELQERERCAKMLAEKTEEAVELRKALTNALTPPDLPRSERTNAGQGAVQTQSRDRSTVSPFATPLGRRSSSMQWTPQALPSSSKLPHEVQRASAWDTGNAVAQYNPRFGQPGPMDSPMQNDKDKDTRRNDSVKLLERFVAERDAHKKQASGSDCQSSRRSLPMDDFARLHGPTARKSVSMADMRSRNGDMSHRRETGRRQQPGHDTVSRSTLQAYVEAEEDGDQRGDAT